MLTTIISITILVIVTVLSLNFHLGKWPFRWRRRRKIMAIPFPNEWEKILKNNVPIYRHFPEQLKNQLHGFMQVFLDEKSFEGCGGLELTDEIRITIAAQACILLLNRKPKFYPRLDTILVYPSAYVAEQAKLLAGRFWVKEKTVRLGESWHRGLVVIAWDHAKKKTHDLEEGFNVVLHEFAHQLDREDGRFNGTPILEQPTSYRAWARILSEEYLKLQRRVESGKEDIIDDYGAEDPAEFFAVATETFFEKPRQMKSKHPKLYEELKSYYKLDPFEWLKDAN